MTQSPHRPESRPSDADTEYASDMAVLQSVFAASPDCIEVLDREGNLLFMNQTGRKLLEIADFDKLHLRSWILFWPGQSQEAAAALVCAQAGGTGRFAAERHELAGQPRFWEVQVSPISGPGGRLLAVSRDVTAQHGHSIELNHRVKNQMAVVQSIVNQTLRGAYPPDAAKKIIAARLDVLARTHDLLIMGRGEQVLIRAIVDAATQLLDGRRVALSGPDLVIGPKAALSLALILHELSSNAIAHGAFSVSDGQVAISWGQCEMDGEPAFEMTFAESGGPPVAPPSVKGFGSRLLRAGLSGSASRASLDFHPQGVQFRLVAVLAGVQSQA